MSINCADALSQIPSSCKEGNGLLMPKGEVFSTLDQQFATAADAGDESKWLEDIVANKLAPYHKIKEVEDLTAESTNKEYSSGDIVFLYEGKVRYKTTRYLSVEQHKAARGLTGKRGRIYLYTRNNKILGTSPDGVIRQGFEMSYTNVETLKMPTADQPAETVIEIQLENPSEMNENLIVIDPSQGTVANSWKPYNLPTNTKVTITQEGSIAADVVTFFVQAKSDSVTDNDGNPVAIAGIEGLDVTTFTNFKFVVGGVVTAPSAMTEVAGESGKYTATVTGIATSDTIEILPTTDNVYNSDATAVTT